MRLSDVRSISRVSVAAGTIALAVGIAVIAVPSLASSIPITSTWAVPVALVSLALGLVRARHRYRREVEHIDLPTPEFPFSMPTPGDELDEMVYQYVHERKGTLEYPEQIGNRLREVAVAAIAHREDCSEEEAIGRLDDGSWTDNQWAQAFFDDDSYIPEPSLTERVSRLLGRGETEYERQVRETIDAIVETATLVETPRARESESEETDEEGLLDRLLSGGSGELRQFRSVRDFLDDEGEYVTEGIRYRGTEWTGRWRGIEAITLVTVAAGVLAFDPGLVLAGSVGVGYAVYARSGTDPSLTQLSVERHVSDSMPAPGEEVEVTVTVENEGSTLVPDVRIVDLLPPNMRVVEGSPRLYTSFRAGTRTAFTYTIEAERGNHEWPLLAVGSGLSGSVEREAIVDVDTGISCTPRLETITDVPARTQTTVYSGQVATSTGGPGLEFYSVREYRQEDPMRRVNWKRLAQTGELSTINFRKEEAANVVLLFDAREDVYVSEAPDRRHALDRAVDAGTEIYTALSEEGNLVGVAAFDTVPCWLSPGAGDGHDESARQLFATHPALSSLPPDMLELGSGYVDPMTHIRKQLSANTQVMMFSPLNGNYPVEVARRLDSTGHRVSVISPDPTASETPGQRLSQVERAIRVNRLRKQDIRVLDWKLGEPFRLAVEKAATGWQA